MFAFNTSIALVVAAYLIAGVLFILSLRGLSSQETARRGNLYGILGMVIAIGATLTLPVKFHPSLFGAIAIGALVGGTMAARVGMTQMPEMVALLHSFVGLAAVLVGYSLDLAPHGVGPGEPPVLSQRIEIYVDVWIGAITTTGSVLAFGKLRGSISGKPLLLPARHWLNLALLLGSIACAYVYSRD